MLMSKPQRSASWFQERSPPPDSVHLYITGRFQACAQEYKVMFEHNLKLFVCVKHMWGLIFYEFSSLVPDPGYPSSMYQNDFRMQTFRDKKINWSHSNSEPAWFGHSSQTVANITRQIIGTSVQKRKMWLGKESGDISWPFLALLRASFYFRHWKASSLYEEPEIYIYPPLSCRKIGKGTMVSNK